MHKAYKYRVYPNKVQINLLNKTFGCVRFIWNKNVKSFKNKEVIKIDRFFPSSKTCSSCGSIKKDLKLSDRIYDCECSNSIDRDLNASINILSAGVNADQRSWMESKTYENSYELSKAIPGEMINFLNV